MASSSKQRLPSPKSLIPGLDDGLVVRVERGREREITVAILSQPQVVFVSPRVAVRVDEPVPQHQLREAVPGSRQILPGVLAGAHQIAGGFLIDRRNMDGYDFVQLEQPRQVQRWASAATVFHQQKTGGAPAKDSNGT
jgi:hypothetical protein